MIKRVDLYLLVTSLASTLAINTDLYTDRFIKYRSLLTGENVVLEAPITRQAVDTSCLVNDIHCVLEEGNIIDAFFSVHSAADCQYTCAQTVKNCRAFTWFGDLHPIFPNSCFLFTGCKKARQSGGTVSGPVSCSCGSHSACQGVKGNFVKFQENVGEENTCQGSCKDNTRCKFYTWFGPENKIFSGYCFLFSSCDKSSCNCKDCYSGPPSCFQYEIVQDPEILEDDPSGDEMETGGPDPLFPNLIPEQGQIPNLPAGIQDGLPEGDNGGLLESANVDLLGVVNGGLTGADIGGFPGGEADSLIGGVIGNTGGSVGLESGGIMGSISGGLNVLQPGGGFFSGGIASSEADIGNMAGAILALNPDGSSMEKYQSAVINYMPALKWLLVVMDHQRKLKQEDGARHAPFKINHVH